MRDRGQRRGRRPRDYCSATSGWAENRLCALNSRRDPSSSAPGGGRDGREHAFYLRRVMATGVAPVRRCTRAGVPAGTRLRRDMWVARQIRRVTRGTDEFGLIKELEKSRSDESLEPRPKTDGTRSCNRTLPPAPGRVCQRTPPFSETEGRAKGGAQEARAIRWERCGRSKEARSRYWCCSRHA